MTDFTLPTYDAQNIFAKILRGEIPNNTVYEDEQCLCFHDIAPKAPTHLLLIPKTPVTDARPAAAEALQAHLLKVVNIIAKQEGFYEAGYQLVTNAGEGIGQEVPHLHWHILAGKRLV